MAIVNKPDINYGVWAENGNIKIPASEKVEEGWVVEKPLNEQMNWLQNRSDRMLQYINQRGIPEWDFRTEYPENAFVARSGVIYQAFSQNQDADPTLNVAIWEIAFVTYSDFSNYSDIIDNIQNTDEYLDYYVAKSAPVMTAAAKGVAYNNTTNVSGYGFTGTKPEIKNEGITVAEFGDGTSPKDIVTHEQLALAIQNYKIGDIYITTASGDPSERLGYGTWSRFGEGKTLVGFNSTVSNNIPEWVKIAGSEFGDYEHKLTVDEIPSHNHAAPRLRGNVDIDHGGVNNTSDALGVTSDVGGDQPHNNVQPSIVVYFWTRIT